MGVADSSITMPGSRRLTDCTNSRFASALAAPYALWASSSTTTGRSILNTLNRLCFTGPSGEVRSRSGWLCSDLASPRASSLSGNRVG